jgi:hypothetical protein
MKNMEPTQGLVRAGLGSQARPWSPAMGMLARLERAAAADSFSFETIKRGPWPGFPKNVAIGGGLISRMQVIED